MLNYICIIHLNVFSTSERECFRDVLQMSIYSLKTHLVDNKDKAHL